MTVSPADTPFDRAADQIVEIGRRLDRFGWVPSLGGNISVRLDDVRIAITRSGGRKGFLRRDGIMEVGLEGRSLTEGGRSSAETALHCQLYRAFPDVGAVVHGHSVAATVLTRVLDGDGIALSGYEMIKAFSGQTTHETTIVVPVFGNDQDMDRLCGAVAARLDPTIPSYVLRGHGVYAWGRDAEQAIAHYEALEFLIACELEARKVVAS